MDDDDTIFITQNTFQQSEEDSVSSNECAMAYFGIKSDIYSDISEEDEESVNSGTQVQSEICGGARFLQPNTEDNLVDLIQKEIPKGTRNKTDLAVKLFDSWLQQRNRVARTKGDGTVTEIQGNLLTLSLKMLEKALCFFISEVRNQKGEEYYPNTLYELIISIQRYLRENDRNLSLLDEKAFRNVRKVLDAKMKELSRSGRGLSTRKAEVITTEQEEAMWQQHVLGTDTPKQLIDTVLYMIGLNFALRAGQEHRSLRVGNNSQITIKESPTDGIQYLEYKEDVSKTNCGGINHRKIDPKIVRAYENKDHPDRCIVTILKKYMSLRPEDGNCNAFYLRPKKYPTQTVWFDDAPIGVHQLQKTVGELCKKAGFHGHYTNHSLRATAATRLYTAGVDEQLIAEKTGHRSSAVRGYKRTNEEQLKQIDNVINAKCPKNDSTPFQENKENHKTIHIDTGTVKIDLRF